jgi:virginiamycin B lyase
MLRSTRNVLILALALCAGAFLAACGGGSSSPVPLNAGSTPAPGGTASTTVSVSPSSSTTATVGPASGGLSGSIVFPPSTTSSHVTLTISASAAPGTPALASLHRAPQAIRGSSLSLFAVESISVDADTSFTAPLTYSIAFAGTGSSAPDAATSYVAIFDPTNANAGWTLIAGPASASGTTLTWSSSWVALTLKHGVSYGIAFFTGQSVGPSATITEFAAVSPGAHLRTIVSSNGALWFADLSNAGNAEIGRMTTQGTVSARYPLPNLEGDITVAAGPPSTANAVAFSAVNGQLQNDVGFFTGSGLQTYSAASSPCQDPMIAYGSDGNVWTCGEEGALAHNGVTSIARVTQGAVTTFPLSGPTGSGAPYVLSIAPGPDGALWYAGYAYVSNTVFVPVVGRITIGGAVTDFSAAAAKAGVQLPVSIVAGPDGALWFSDATPTSPPRGGIGRITTSGVVTEYALPSSLPGAITRGPDGALWFVDQQTNAIGRITTSGQVTEYSSGITPGAVPVGITTGPDGALWFTEEVTGKIGRLSISATAPSAVRRSPALQK